MHRPHCLRRRRAHPGRRARSRRAWLLPGRPQSERRHAPRQHGTRAARAPLHAALPSAAVRFISPALRPSSPTLLDLTRMSAIIPNFESEDEAILAFLDRSPAQKSEAERGPRLLVFDPSADLCTFARTVLSQRGFNVQTTCSFGDAKLLLRVDRADYILVGPCSVQLPPEMAARGLAAIAPQASILQLSSRLQISRRPRGHRSCCSRCSAWAAHSQIRLPDRSALLLALPRTQCRPQRQQARADCRLLPFSSARRACAALRSHCNGLLCIRSSRNG